MMDIVALTKEFCEASFVQRSCSRAISLLARNIEWCGATEQEDVHSREEAQQLLAAFIAGLSTDCRVDYLEARMVGADAAFLRLRL